MKQKILIALPVLCLLVFATRCKSPSNYIDKNTYEKISQICPGSENFNLVIYYFDGDCSLCIGKAKHLEDVFSKKSGVRPVFIAQTANPDILRFNLDQIKIKSCVYIDRRNSFAKLLKMNEIIQVKKDRSYDIYEFKN